MAIFIASCNFITTNAVPSNSVDGSTNSVQKTDQLTEILSEDYKVWVDDVEIPVHLARVQDPPFDPVGTKRNYGGNYSFVSFDISKAVKVRILSNGETVKYTVFRPNKVGITDLVKQDQMMTFVVNEPAKYSIEPDGKNTPLLLFANPIEQELLDKNDPNVIYFGPGVHSPESEIIVGDNQTLYLAAGAVVKSGVIVSGNNTTICGRGILCGNHYIWRKTARHMILVKGNNVLVKDIVIRGGASWTMRLQEANQVKIENVKILGGRAQNDDGINPVNSSDVVIDNCFIRTDDDCIAIKGMMKEKPYFKNAERITVKNSILWADRARVVLFAHESRAEYIRDILFENVDIIHFKMTAVLIEPGEDLKLENVFFKDIRFNGEGQRELIRLKPTINKYMHTQIPGYIKNINFDNVSLNGLPGEYLIQLIGYDEKYNISGVNFSDIVINGDKINQDSKNIEMNGFVEDVNFK